MSAELKPLEWGDWRAYDCPNCQDSGWQQLRLVDGSAAVRRCQQPNHIAPRLAALGVPPRYQYFMLSSFSPETAAAQQAKQSASTFAHNFGTEGNGLLFYGPAGSGKTHLSVGMMRAIIAESATCPRFADSGELLRQLDPELNLVEAAERKHLFDSVMNTDLLILDDLAEVAPEQRETLEHIIGYRYRHMLPIIITTRFDVEELKRQAGASMLSRLAEMCEFVSLV